MMCHDVTVFEVCDGAGKLEDAVKSTTGEMELLHSGA